MSGRTASSYTGGILSTARQPVSHSNRSRFFIAAPRPSTNSWFWHMVRDCRCPRLHLGRVPAFRSCWEREAIPPQPVKLTSSEQTAQTRPQNWPVTERSSPVLPLCQRLPHVPLFPLATDPGFQHDPHCPCLSQDATRCFLHLGNPKSACTSSPPWHSSKT